MLIVAPIIGVLSLLKTAKTELKCIPVFIAVFALVAVVVWLRYLYLNLTSTGATTDYEEEYSEFENECNRRHDDLLAVLGAWMRGDVSAKTYLAAEKEFTTWRDAEMLRLSYKAAGSANFNAKFRR